MKQYIDFYNANNKAIEAHSAPGLQTLRGDALMVVETSQLPKKGDEDYEVVSLQEIFAADYGININRLDVPADLRAAFRCGVPNMSTCLFTQVNDVFIANEHSESLLPEGMMVMSFKKASEICPGVVEEYLGKIAPMNNQQVALNTLLAEDGILIYLRRGVTVSRPLQLVNIMAGKVPTMANRRILIVLEDGASLRVLSCDHTQNPDLSFLANTVVEIALGRDSSLDIYDLEESMEATNRVNTIYARQSEGSSLLINNITLINGVTRNNVNVRVEGAHCETHINGMAIANKSRVVDNHTFIDHVASDCHSNELFKYLLDDNAQGAFSGLIKVQPGADRIQAYQSNKNILAQPSAKMFTKPQLIINTDEVKCSHGATIGQLDNKALFYMRTRGISEHEARLLLMQAFMSDVIETVRIESLRERLHHLVELTLQGSMSKCADCATACHDLQPND